MFKNIIFDWSGPIKEVVESHFWVVSRMFEKLGTKKISLQEARESWEQPYMRFWKKYYPELTLDDEQKLYYEIVSMKGYPKSRAYKGVIELIKKLKKKGVLLAVLSSDPTERLLSEIKQFGLENIFEKIITNVHDKAEKIHELVGKNKFDKKETVFIGDSNHEIEVGKGAGIKTIAVTWGFSTEEKLKSTNPDYLVHNIKELEKILLS
jgi:phosphoglycolate phosphatase